MPQSESQAAADTPFAGRAGRRESDLVHHRQLTPREIMSVEQGYGYSEASAVTLARIMDILEKESPAS